MEVSQRLLCVCRGCMKQIGQRVSKAPHFLQSESRHFSCTSAAAVQTLFGQNDKTKRRGRETTLYKFSRSVHSDSSLLGTRKFQKEKLKDVEPAADLDLEETEWINTTHPLPQVEVPTLVEGELLQNLEFRGMSTEFPCLTKNKMNGPEPDYDKIISGYKLFTCNKPFPVKYNRSILPQLEVAYETWGELNEDRSNAVIIHAGLSASSHARSHKDNERPGWWEKFVGPGCAVDTNKFFVICTNNIGSCYGSTGPSSVNPVTAQRYATTFPVISVDDMVNAHFRLLDHLGIEKLHSSVGSSLGGMCSLMSAALYPDRVGRVVSISSCAQSHPSSVAMRYLQRKTIMCDPNWKKGYYYDGDFPKIGMKLAREIATLTYRSGPEWDQRFGRSKIDDKCPSLCPTFSIESYLEHQGESFSTKYDPNSLLYISKAMDLFDMAEGFNSLEEGLQRVTCPVMVIGVQTDILFPIRQQRLLAKLLQDGGNPNVTFYELNSIYGHDTFLLDLNGVGAGVKGFIETDLKNGLEVKQPLVEQHKKDRVSF